MAETTEIKLQSEALTDLDDLLQCPVCYEIPSGQIFQCNEGHHVCGRCKARLDLCPVCRSLFFGTRNYAMEELIANMKKLQIFKIGGKLTVTSGSGGSESTVSADNSLGGGLLDNSLGEDANNDYPRPVILRAPAACKGLFRCLCCKNGNSERLPAARLLNHLRYFHAPELIEGNSEEGEYMQAWQIATVPGRIVIAVRVSDMGIFFLVIEISKQSIYAWVSMAAAPWVASDFGYTITISGNDREAVFSDCVWSVRTCEGALKKRSRCLVVNGSDVRALAAARELGGRLTLRRTPADGVAPHAQPRAVLRVATRGAADSARSSDSSHSSHSSSSSQAADVAPPHALEPYLQELHDGVERLSRAFATLGQEADAIARNGVREEPSRRRPGNGAVPPARVEGPPREPVARLSRSARRRLRRRLNGAARAVPEEAEIVVYASGPPAPQPPLVPPSRPPRGGAADTPAVAGRKIRRQRR